MSAPLDAQIRAAVAEIAELERRSRKAMENVRTRYSRHRVRLDGADDALAQAQIARQIIKDYEEPVKIAEEILTDHAKLLTALADKLEAQGRRA